MAPLRHSLDGICYLDVFLGALVVAIALVTSRKTGWANSQLRTTLRRPGTCYRFFTNYIHICYDILYIIQYNMISADTPACRACGNNPEELQ